MISKGMKGNMVNVFELFVSYYRNNICFIIENSGVKIQGEKIRCHFKKYIKSFRNKHIYMLRSVYNSVNYCICNYYVNYYICYMYYVYIHR